MADVNVNHPDKSADLSGTPVKDGINIDNPKIRLQKYLANCGVASRRHAEELIAQGRVRVNGDVVTQPGSTVVDGDTVLLDGNPVLPETRKVVILYHKPYGEISSASDPEGRPTVLDKFRDYGVRLYPVGRLDWDSEGVLLLTNDGELANRMTHPKFMIKKTYLARVDGHISDDDLARLRHGVMLTDGQTNPAEVRVIQTTEAETVVLITISEGRNRQIRRMAEAVGHKVMKLRRVQFGSVNLGSLKRGEWRELSRAEIENL
ncbi:MAG: rRNA pseudouridine synthase [Oscillospiraceae bacterium]|nr:rRNA pseudouridine synthase [Oscillospiraceae bacterium]